MSMFESRRGSSDTGAFISNDPNAFGDVKMQRPDQSAAREASHSTASSAGTRPELSGKEKFLEKYSIERYDFGGQVSLNLGKHTAEEFLRDATRLNNAQLIDDRVRKWVESDPNFRTSGRQIYIDGCVDEDRTKRFAGFGRTSGVSTLDAVLASIAYRIETSSTVNPGDDMFGGFTAQTKDGHLLNYHAKTGIESAASPLHRVLAGCFGWNTMTRYIGPSLGAVSAVLDFVLNDGVIRNPYAAKQIVPMRDLSGKS